MFFQQDGTTCHTSIDIERKNFSDNEYPYCE